MKILEFLFPNKQVVPSVITPDTIQNFKLSDIILKVIDDIQYARAKGVKINMDTWGELDKNGKLCAVCLGGAAAMGLMTPKQMKLLPEINMGGDNSAVDNTAFADAIDNGNEWKIKCLMNMFNQIRAGYYEEAFDYYNSFAANEIPDTEDLDTEFREFIEDDDLVTHFEGLIDKEDIKELTYLLLKLHTFLDTKNL